MSCVVCFMILFKKNYSLKVRCVEKQMKCQRHDSPNQPHGRKNVDALRERNGEAELNGKETFFSNLASLAESAFSG